MKTEPKNYRWVVWGIVVGIACLMCCLTSCVVSGVVYFMGGNKGLFEAESEQVEEAAPRTEDKAGGGVKVDDGKGAKKSLGGGQTLSAKDEADVESLSELMVVTYDFRSQILVAPNDPIRMTPEQRRAVDAAKNGPHRTTRVYAKILSGESFDAGSLNMKGVMAEDTVSERLRMEAASLLFQRRFRAAASKYEEVIKGDGTDPAMLPCAIAHALSEGDNRATSLERAVELADKLLAMPDEIDLAKAECHGVIGRVAVSLMEESESESAREGINPVKGLNHLKEAQRLWARFGNANAQAWALWNQGRILAASKDADSQEVLAAYEAAMKIWTRDRDAVKWARVKDSAGSFWHRNASEESDENLLKAVECYESALEVLNERNDPETYRLANLGVFEAVAAMSAFEALGNMARIVKANDEYLRICQKMGMQATWADQQEAMADVRLRMKSSSRELNVRMAIESYEKALGVWEVKSPERWKNTQKQLGILWMELGEDKAGKNAENAVKAFRLLLEAEHKDGTAAHQTARTKMRLAQALARWSNCDLVDSKPLRKEAKALLLEALNELKESDSTNRDLAAKWIRALDNPEK